MPWASRAVTGANDLAVRRAGAPADGERTPLRRDRAGLVADRRHQDTLSSTLIYNLAPFPGWSAQLMQPSSSVDTAPQCAGAERMWWRCSGDDIAGNKRAHMEYARGPPQCDSSPTITLWHIDAGSRRRPPHQVGQEFGSAPSSTMICVISIWSREPCNPLTTPLGPGCHLCLRYVLSPMCPGRTKIKMVAGVGFEPTTFRL